MNDMFTSNHMLYEKAFGIILNVVKRHHDTHGIFLKHVSTLSYFFKA